jgi:hypothetical protein
MNIVRFEMNVPAEIALQSPQGTLVAGRYGDRVMFPLADGRVMYVPPVVASQIETQGIAAGEPFQLCKVNVKAGRSRSIEWRVRRIATELPEVAEPSGASARPPLPPGLGLLRASDLAPRPNPEPAAKVSASSNTPPPPPLLSQPGTHNGNGHAGLTPNGVSPPPVATKLEHALKTAIVAASNAEKYGAELGYVVRFDSDAIKSMAITVLINMSEGGRR